MSTKTSTIPAKTGVSTKTSTIVGAVATNESSSLKALQYRIKQQNKLQTAEKLGISCKCVNPNCPSVQRSYKKEKFQGTAMVGSVIYVDVDGKWSDIQGRIVKRCPDCDMLCEPSIFIARDQTLPEDKEDVRAEMESFNKEHEDKQAQKNQVDRNDASLVKHSKYSFTASE